LCWTKNNKIVNYIGTPSISFLFLVHKEAYFGGYHVKFGRNSPVNSWFRQNSILFLKKLK
jgi:hypothetical protein